MNAEAIGKFGAVGLLEFLNDHVQPPVWLCSPGEVRL